ncbi:MAG: hypothetical protein AB1714_15805 [Acidobacteriota bacterium]
MNTTNRIKKRLDRNRPMVTISIRMPEDVIEDLKMVAPCLGFSGYQPLIRTYIGQCLRKDLARLEHDQIGAFAEILRGRGVDEKVIADAMAEVLRKTA